MTLYQCDLCGSQYLSELAFTIKGISPSGSGILLPDSQQRTILCSSSCVLAWFARERDRIATIRPKSSQKSSP